MKIKISEIYELCIKISMQRGLNRGQAKIMVDEYLDGQLRGRECHGFSAFPKFAISKLKTFGKKHEIKKDEDCFTLIDGKGGMGQLVLHEEYPKIIKKSKSKGIAMLGIYNMHSYLMPGTYARIAAKEELIGMVCDYGGNPRVAPFGSIDPIFSTNPIAVGIPSLDLPIIVDMATAEFAMGKVRLCKKLGCEIREGVAIDKDGKPTTDPVEAMEGALLPFGGYKGSAISLVIEVLSRCLFNIPLDNEIKGKRGFLFILIDPSKFTQINDFKKNVSDLIKKIKTSRKAEGVDEIFFPGERSEKIKKENLKKGYVEIDEKIIEEIKGLVK